MPKRKFDEENEGVDDDEASSTCTADDDVGGNDVKKARCDKMNEATTSKRSNEHLTFHDPNLYSCAILENGDDASAAITTTTSQQPSKKKRVDFGAVSIYYFQRSQGFSCVPTSGGSTLGMSRKHHFSRVISVNDHLEEIRRQRQIYVDEQRRPATYHQQQRQSLNGVQQSNAAEIKLSQYVETSADDEEFDGDEQDEDEEYDEEEGDEEAAAGDDEGQQEESVVGYCADEAAENGYGMPDDYYLQPLDSKQRRTMLRAIGVQVDRDERDECQAIRVSRQSCGCSCRGQCMPETCACALENIKCQVDRPSFPCACTKNTCGNPYGRVEFNAVRVRTHYLHTMMRIRMEGKQNTVLPSPKHVRFDEPEGYVDMHHEIGIGQDLSDGRRNEESTIPGFHTFFTSFNQNGYASSVITNGTPHNQTDNQNLWSFNNDIGSGSAGKSQSSAYDMNGGGSPYDAASNGYYPAHQIGGKTMNDSVSQFLHISRSTAPATSNEYNNGKYHQEDSTAPFEPDLDDDVDADPSSRKMRDRSASFSMKSSAPSELFPNGEQTYSLASLYPHQNHYNGLNGARSHAFNEFLDPMYFPTFAMADGCRCGGASSGLRCECTSNEDDDDEGASSSFPSDESNSMDGEVTTKMMGDKLNGGQAAYLPSSPAELSAVLKKSICETVLA